MYTSQQRIVNDTMDTDGHLSGPVEEEQEKLAMVKSL